MDIYSSSTRFPQPSLEGLKNQAKRLRSALAEDGVAISHSQSLERIAHQFGYADWNTLHALAGNTAPVFTPAIGQRVRDVQQGPDGLLYVLTDESNGQLIRLEPVDG